MKKYHLGSFSGRGGISHYSSRFFEHVLRVRGYERLDTESSNGCDFDFIKCDDTVHVEIGVNERASISALYALIDRGCHRISVTLHDPPFIAWPYFNFRSRPINLVSKVVHLYLNSFGLENSYFERINRIFVLTQLGAKSTIERHGLSNVYQLPFLVDIESLRLPVLPPPPNLLFFGFISKNKGLDYALAVHERLLTLNPQCRILVAGEAVDAPSNRYLRNLKSRYIHNVEYLGFVGDNELAEVFAQTSIALMPFLDYRTIVPASASILTAMSAGKVVCATAVNAIPELIRDGYNGLLLTGNIERDAERIQSVISNERLVIDIVGNAAHLLRSNNEPSVVGRVFDAAIGM